MNPNHLIKKLMFTLVTGLLSGIILTSCYHRDVALKRAYLQDPLMDPSKTVNLSDRILKRTLSAHEIGAVPAVGSTSGTCPTCGG